MCARVRCTGLHTIQHDTAKGGKEGDAEDAHTGCTGVNYASREMSNCSPYRKIYNSARCGKHYVLSRVLPLRVRLPWPFHLQPPSVPTVHPPRAPSPPFSLPSRFLTPARPSRFANKFARRTAIVLTSKQPRRSLPEIHFSRQSRYNAPRCHDIVIRDDMICTKKKNQLHNYCSKI